MKVKITRKRDVHTFTGVKSAKVIRKGIIFPNMSVDLLFGKGATSHYVSDKHDMKWDIKDTSAGMGSNYCQEIEITDESVEEKTITHTDINHTDVGYSNNTDIHHSDVGYSDHPPFHKTSEEERSQ